MGAALAAHWRRCMLIQHGPRTPSASMAGRWTQFTWAAAERVAEVLKQSGERRRGPLEQPRELVPAEQGPGHPPGFADRCGRRDRVQRPHLHQTRARNPGAAHFAATQHRTRGIERGPRRAVLMAWPTGTTIREAVFRCPAPNGPQSSFRVVAAAGWPRVLAMPSLLRPTGNAFQRCVSPFHPPTEMASKQAPCLRVRSWRGNTKRYKRQPSC